MTFFDVPPPEQQQEPVVEYPEWMDPPRGVLPGHSTQRAVLFKTDDAFLVVHRFLAYPNGVEFSLSLFLRDQSYRMIDVPWEVHFPPGSDGLPNDFLRFGILFGDGSKWTNLDWRYPSEDEEPTGPTLSGRGGSGGDHSWEMAYWLWPLPPEGPLTFVVSWPIRDIPEQRVEIDANEIRDRAREAETIWRS